MERLLTLLQLCDSALPIGTAAHSFGLETLAAEGMLAAEDLALFLRDLVGEVGALEGAFCREAHQLAVRGERGTFAPEWIALNHHQGAFKPARESRVASATLGRRFLRLAAELGVGAGPATHSLRSRVPGCPSLLGDALSAAARAGAEVHLSAAFGLTGGVFRLEEEVTVLAYLQQSLAGTISACQRLLPVGQTQACRLLWDLKPALIAAAARSRERPPEEAEHADPFPGPLPPESFAPLVEIGAMRHPDLTTRLFIS